MMHEFLAPKGRYHPHHGHMADNSALCDWVCVSQDKLRIIHDHFEHYLNSYYFYEFLLLSYRMVYELLLLSYCYTFVWCLMKCVLNVIWTEFLMKCVPEYCPIQQRRMRWCQLTRCCCMASSDRWADVNSRCCWPSQKQQTTRSSLLRSPVAMDRWYQIARLY
jgi:hypothetical protein